MFFVSIFAGFIPIKSLGHMVSIGTLFAFSLVCLGVLIMRKTKPEVRRKFKVPLVPYIPVAGILVCVYLMTSLGKESWERLFIWLFLGIIIYVFYSRKQSKLNK